jgi:Domain of unknown function (DUF6285)
MRDLPPATDILQTAHTLMRERIIPALPDVERYNGLLIASAMAIVARELANGTETARREAAEHSRLGALLGQWDTAPVDLWRSVARRIRAGEYDPAHPGHEQVLALLRATVRADLELCNPAYLAPTTAR